MQPVQPEPPAPAAPAPESPAARTLADLPTPRDDRLVGRITGQAFQMWFDHQGLIHRTLHECGDYARLRLFRSQALVVSSAVGATTVLQSDASRYDKQTPGYRQVARVLGDGLFTADGAQWRDNRVVLQPFFTKATLDHYAVKMRHHARALAGSLQPGRVALDEEMVRLTLRILGDCLFEEDFEPYVPLMIEEFVSILDVVNRRVISHVPVISALNRAEERRFQRSLARFNQAVEELVAKALADPARAASGTSVIHALAADPATRDPKNVRDQVITLMFAGHETSAVALQWIFHLLAAHPDWRARVEAEADAGAEPEVLRRVIHETLRLYPPVWIVTRRILDEAVIDGIHVRNGTLLLVCPYNIHRNPRYWPDPDAFDPDRFLPERLGAHQKGQYLPFGMGKRACVGANLAMLELTTIVSELVRAVRLDAWPGHTPKTGSSLTLRPEGGMPVQCSRRARADDGGAK